MAPMSVPNRATPIALPAWRDTLNTAEATPAPSAGAASMIATVAATTVTGVARPVAMRAKSSTGYGVSGPAVSQPRKPATPSSSAPVIGTYGPVRAVTRLDSGAARKPMQTDGSRARPVSSALKPRSCWKYSVATKSIP